MKKFLIYGVILCLLCGTAAAYAPDGIEVVNYDDGANYLALMYDCVEDGSTYALAMGAIYEQQRNLKIENNNLEDALPTTNFFTVGNAEETKKLLDEYLEANNYFIEPLNEDDVRIIATTVYNEAWCGCTTRHRELVAAVIMNRVHSDYSTFANTNTVYDVICARGQYHSGYTVDGGYYHKKASANPEAWNECVLIAERALRGEIECPENVLFQSNYSSLGVYNEEYGRRYYEVCNTSYSTTYFAFGY